MYIVAKTNLRGDLAEETTEYRGPIVLGLILVGQHDRRVRLRLADHGDHLMHQRQRRSRISRAIVCNHEGLFGPVRAALCPGLQHRCASLHHDWLGIVDYVVASFCVVTVARPVQEQWRKVFIMSGYFLKNVLGVRSVLQSCITLASQRKRMGMGQDFYPHYIATASRLKLISPVIAAPKAPKRVVLVALLIAAFHDRPDDCIAFSRLNPAPNARYERPSCSTRLAHEWQVALRGITGSNPVYPKLRPKRPARCE